MKKREDKAYVQRFFRKYTYVKHIPSFDSLQPSQKDQFQNTFTYQTPLPHVCNIFSTKTHLFHSPYFID